MMRPLLALLLLGITGCAVALGPPTTHADQLEVALFDGAGASVGTVTLTLDRSGETLALVFDVHDLPPGSHGTHIHSIGLCERPDFLSAGPHLDDGEHQHGRQNPDGPHLGDLGDLIVNDDGTARRTLLMTPARGDIRMSLIFGGDGSAVVIHADPDDQRTDPAGKSGARIACGIIT
jgi:Cu-Zn family superoxide dismutase